MTADNLKTKVMNVPHMMLHILELFVLVSLWPGFLVVRKCGLQTKKVALKLYPAVPSSPGCGLLGQRTVFGLMALTFPACVWINLIQFDIIFIFSS